MVWKRFAHRIGKMKTFRDSKGFLCVKMEKRLKMGYICRFQRLRCRFENLNQGLRLSAYW